MAVITGNVTRDPELRYTPSGTPVCSFGVATNHSIKKDDQWTDIPTFHNIVVWGKSAEYISNTVKKGMKVSLTGRIDNRQYDAKDGTKKYISEIIADTVIPFTERKTTSEVDDVVQEPDQNQKLAGASEVDAPVEDIVIPDEMPF